MAGIFAILSLKKGHPLKHSQSAIGSLASLWIATSGVDAGARVWWIGFWTASRPQLRALGSRLRPLPQQLHLKQRVALLLL